MTTQPEIWIEPAARLYWRDGTPLCVDLDGTLANTDMLMELVFALLRRNVLYLFLLPLWLVKGKANLKHQIARRVDIDPALLPYNEAFLDYLRSEHAAGRRLVLATASHVKLARAIAEHLELFEDVIATDARENVAGERKLERLRAAFGDKGFDYAGNDGVDLCIWPHARRAVLVNASPRVARIAASTTEVERTFEGGAGRLRAYVKALRLHQWLKNLLVFVPLLAAHHVADAAILGKAALAFLAFGLCASSVYVLNDLLDLAADRRHPSKCLRPFAAGTVPILHGAVMTLLLLGAAVAVSLALPLAFLGVLGVYYAATLAYSLGLKRIVLMDVLVLAGLYTIRVIAGGYAVSVPISFWLLAFSMFLFLSLAMVKRYAELQGLPPNQRASVYGRGYQVVDLEALISFGSAGGYLAVLVFALYINSGRVRELYEYPNLMWLLCPLLLYWVSRMWLAARRGEMHDDPVVYASRDRFSQMMMVAGAVILWVAA